VSQAVHSLLSSRVESLVLGRRHHPDRGVQPCRVVPVHPLAGLPFNGPLVVWHPHCPEEFGLVEAIDGLCERIVVGVAGGAHRGSKTSGWESGRVGDRELLQASVRVMDEPVGAPSLAKRHLQGIGGELACEGARDLPPDDHP